MIYKINQGAKLDNFGMIPVHPGKAAIVDLDDYENLIKYKWYIIKQHGHPYAARKKTTNGKTYFVRMHRQIMHTPKGQIVHHKNRQTLDNRKKNLENMTDIKHKFSHKDPLSVL